MGGRKIEPTMRVSEANRERERERGTEGDATRGANSISEAAEDAFALPTLGHTRVDKKNAATQCIRFVISPL